jgi:hypothetical protein
VSKRGLYIGGQTVIHPGSGWFSRAKPKKTVSPKESENNLLQQARRAKQKLTPARVSKILAEIEHRSVDGRAPLPNLRKGATVKYRKRGRQLIKTDLGPEAHKSDAQPAKPSGSKAKKRAQTSAEVRAAQAKKAAARYRARLEARIKKAVTKRRRPSVGRPKIN